MGVKLNVTMSTDDDAWYDENGEIADYSTQVATHLERVVRHIRAGRTGGDIVDVNGNRIGSWKLR